MNRFIVALLATFTFQPFALTVDWSIRGVNPFTSNPNESFECSYKSVYTLRPAKRHSSPPVATLNFKRPQTMSRLEHEMCQAIASNLTNLDQPLVREQLAAIIKDFPCPEANINIRTFQRKNPALKLVSPAAYARSPRTLSSFIVEGCLKDTPEECRVPMTNDPSFMITFEDLREGLIRCRDAMKDAVRKGAELANWKKQNNPNGKKASTDQEHNQY